VKSTIQPSGAHIIEFKPGDDYWGAQLTGYIDAWAWMDQNTMGDVMNLVWDI
jgi:hypothetical protein